MSEFHEIITLVAKYRPSILADPMMALQIMADDLQDRSDLGEEAAHAIRYWRDVRSGLRKPQHQWEDWYVKVMEKYGPPFYEQRGAEGVLLAKLSGRLLTMFTAAEFERGSVYPDLVSGHPIVTVTIKRVEWAGLSRLSSEVFQNTEDLTLDFRESMSIFQIGVVASCEYMQMPRLKNLGIMCTETKNTGPLKGRTSVALMDAVRQGRVPNGVTLWWNGKPA